MSSPVPLPSPKPAAIRPLTVFPRPPDTPVADDVDPWAQHDPEAAKDAGADGDEPGPAPVVRVVDAPPDLSGTVLGDRYELVRRIGVGGMGEVYEACFLPSGQRVAVKLLAERLADSEEMVTRFRHELRALEAIRHPAIVTARDFGTSGGRPYLVMEFVVGEDLSRRRKRPVDEVARIGIQICAGLEAMHAQGIVHRDLKPHNIIVRGEGRGLEVTIVDFGVSKLTALYYAQARPYQTPPGQRVQTRKGFSWGTPGYMAPEVFAGEEATPRQDVFSLGVVLFELLVGQRPPQGWLVEIPGDVDHQALGLAALTWRVILKAIEPNPRVRYESAAAFREALEDLLLNVDEDAASELLAQESGAMGAPKNVAQVSGAIDAPEHVAHASADGVPAGLPRRSMGWTVAAILVLLYAVDRIQRLDVADDRVSSAAAVDPAALPRPPDAAPASTTPPADDRPPSTASSASPPAGPADLASASTTPPADDQPATPPADPQDLDPAPTPITTAAVTADPNPRPRRRPLSAEAFRKVIEPKRAALARCERWLRGGPAVDAVVRVAADGSVIDVGLSPDMSSLAHACASKIVRGLSFPVADAASTHTWALFRPGNEER